MKLDEFIKIVENNPLEFFYLKIRNFDVSNFEQLETIELCLQKKTGNPRIDDWLENRLAEHTSDLVYNVKIRPIKSPDYQFLGEVSFDVDKDFLREFILAEIDLLECDFDAPAAG